MGLLDGGEVQGEVADEALDHLAADQIVPVEGAPLPLGMTERLHLGVIGLEILLILGVGIPHHADGRDPQPQQIAIPLGGIALEVAMQLALALGHRQFVIGLGEVIHADELITLTGEEGDGVLQHGQLLPGGRHVFLLQLVLGGEAARQVGIVEDGEAGWIRLENFLQGVVEALPVLVRQAVDEVEIGGAEPQ